MPELQIIDTFGNFLTFWEQVQQQPLTAQIEAWAESYLALWPNLRQMQLEAYAADGEDWRGLGWATTYEGKPAILFGLENIAEEGWQAPETLAGLMAHELGHLLHFDWRRQAELANEDGGWWQLYTEGFAQWCEHLIQGAASWHMQSPDVQWQTWCQANVGWLAVEFLRRMDAGEDLRPSLVTWL